MKKSTDFSCTQSNKKAANKILYDTSCCAPWVSDAPPKTNLRVGGVLGDRLFSALQYEVELISIKEDSWKLFLKHGNLDFIIIESLLMDYSGHWELDLVSSKKNNIDKLINKAKEFKLPTVFWMTKGVEYCDLFLRKAKIFDFVFCSDEKATQEFRDKGVQADYLPPCVQEKIYNPIRSERKQKEIDLLIENWVDLDRSEKFRELTKTVDFTNPVICDLRYITFKKRFGTHLGEINHIPLGKVSFTQRLERLKDSKLKLVTASSHLTTTDLIWECLEAVATGCAVIVEGCFNHELFDQLFLNCHSTKEIKAEVEAMLQNPLFRERFSHKLMREIYTKHTYSHRLKTICSRIGISFNWEEHPKISLVVPTIRPENLGFIYNTFKNQAYPNKELIVVFNTNNFPEDEISEEIEKDPRVKLSRIPTDFFTGGALNLGISLSEGEYIIKADDDDFYFENYASDMVMWAKISGADIFGKSSAPLVFEGDEHLYCKRHQEPPGFLTGKDLLSGVWISGNSLSGKKKFFEESIKFSNEGYGAVDSIFYLSLPATKDIKAFLCDRFNMAALRLLDTTKHTWRADSTQLKRNRVALNSVEEYRV